MIEEIKKHLKDVYKIEPFTSLNSNNQEQINFKSKKIDATVYTFYTNICPPDGFAPNKLLIYFKCEKKDHTGLGGSLIYSGTESIDYIMENIFKLERIENE